MPKKPTRPSFATLEVAKIQAICHALQGDGHGIYREEMFTDLGVPSEFITPLVFTYKSDTRSHKATIYAPGGVALEELRGIGALNLYETIAADLGLPGSDAMGRGFRAQSVHHQIIQWCQEQMATHATRTD